MTENNICPFCNNDITKHSRLELTICYNNWIAKGQVINKEIYKRRFPLTYANQ